MKHDLGEHFFWWKIGTLTHDPPHKAWIISGKHKWEDGLTHDGISLAKTTRLKGHEAAAFAIRANVFAEDIARLFLEDPWKSIVGKSDRLASSFDRWQISEVYDLCRRLNLTDFHPFNVKEIYLFNPLSGNLIKPEPPRRMDLTKFEEKIKDLWKQTSNLDLSLRYHLFYALYEPMFYEKAFGSPGPADTRTPSHTLFDHLYASATVVNWLCLGDMIERDEVKPKGLLVRIDFGGIQDFISASKKLRDVWFSSWFASALAFKTIEELLEKIGPDILVRPTARHNLFYYHFLVRKLEEKGASEKVCKELKEIAKKYAGLGDWPCYAIIPATIDLVLPPYNIISKIIGRNNLHNEEQLGRYLHDRYMECWRNVFKIIIEDGIKRLAKEATEEFKVKLEEAQKEIYQYGVSNAPPFAMRIAVVSVPEDLKPEEKEKEIWCYEYAFKKLEEKYRQMKALKVHHACQTKLTQVTEEAWKNVKRYRACTTCGKFPSILDIPADEGYNKIVPSSLQVYLDFGEHLCPYCLIKRLATHQSIFMSVAKELIGYAASSVGFPSTSSIATYPFMEGLVEARNDSVVRKIVTEIVNKTKQPLLILPYWGALKELIDRAKKSDVEKFLYSEPETTLLSEENQITVGGLQEAVERVVGGIFDPVFTRINTYYAIVRADGDYVGHLFAGYLNQETIGVDYIKLLSRSIENIPDPMAKKFARVLDESANNNRFVVERLLRQEFSDKILEGHVKNIADNLCELFSEVRRHGKVPVTPAYHTMLSRALMITALKDIEAVREEAKGVVVYAGGDDFLAFVPITFSLNLVHKTRKCYGTGDPQHKGFHRMQEGYFMSLGNASRTYSVVFGHFKYPMSRLLSLSLEHLDLAKRSLTVHEAFKKTKDALLLAYCPRGGVKVTSILPLSSEDPIRLLMALLGYIENGLLSHSVIYDLTKYSEVYIKETRQLRAFDTLESMFKYIIKRNIFSQESVVAELISSELKESVNYSLLVNGKENLLPQQTMLALWATISALRGREL